MAHLRKGKGFAQQTAPTRAVGLRPFRESITQTLIQNSSWQSPSSLIRSPRALLVIEKACPESPLAAWGRSPPAAGQQLALSSCLLTCRSRELGPAAAPAALLILPCSHRLALLAEVLRALPRYHHYPLRTLGGSTSQGCDPSPAGQERAGCFPHGNKLLKLAETKCKPQSGL